MAFVMRWNANLEMSTIFVQLQRSYSNYFQRLKRKDKNKPGSTPHTTVTILGLGNATQLATLKLQGSAPLNGIFCYYPEASELRNPKDGSQKYDLHEHVE